MSLKLALIVGLAACRATAAAISTDESLPLLLPVGEVGWSGSVVPGGPEVEYWGEDFEDIEAKIRKSYPDFSIYSDETDEEPEPDVTDDPALLARRALESRQWGKRTCKQFGGVVNPFAINSGISALRRIKGSCKAKKRTCIRNQCHSGAAIGMCNKNTHDISVACTQIANMAAKARTDCYEEGTYCVVGQCTTGYWTRGEVFSKGHTWSVLLGTCDWWTKKGTKPIKG